MDFFLLHLIYDIRLALRQQLHSKRYYISCFYRRKIVTAVKMSMFSLTCKKTTKLAIKFFHKFFIFLNGNNSFKNHRSEMFKKVF